RAARSGLKGQWRWGGRDKSCSWLGAGALHRNRAGAAVVALKLESQKARHPQLLYESTVLWRCFGCQLLG
uniref:Uncharacterized protein n=1 Tax=Chrysemys picta bellii TaxID=8478 RepID=A0A8C3IF45_CHRPI